jgi:ribosomal-protein-alanine N-acetyltransferase
MVIIMSDVFEIETERLILRHPTMDDAAEINAAINEVWEELQRWMVWAHDGQQTMEAIKAFIEAIGDQSLIAMCKDSGKFVMSGGLHNMDAPNEYNTGYWVAKDFLGKGYATEGTLATLHFAFKELKAKAIHIGYLEGNEKSKNIIDKLGFTFVETTSKTHACCLDGTLMDEHEYIMTSAHFLPDIQYRWSGRW